MMGWFGALLERRTLRAGVPLAILLLIVVALAAGTATGTTADCANTATLPASSFEIETDANLKVDTNGCIDWKAVDEIRQPDATGSTDDAFGQGTAEDNPNPTIVTGSIPPNKSDLKAFGVYTETQETDQFLELFWSRVQSPQGTTNMDFELNQKLCDGTATNCANNGTAKNPLYVTPRRTTGDLLITYDLSQGGTVATISIRKWDGSAWGPATTLDGQQARATVNTSTILAPDSDGLGEQDPRTFGEAAISFDALFPEGTCGSFGSAYLKSRSSDSFQAELKDFVPPREVHINNCPTGITTTLSAESITVGSSVHDSATLSGATADAGGTVTYTVYADNQCTNFYADAGTKTVANGVVPDSNSVTFNSAGTFYWQAVYSGDAKNQESTSTCTSETLVVGKAKPSITTTLSAESITVGSSVHDSATLSGATADAGGTVTYTVYADNQCTQGARPAGTKTVTNGSVPDSDSVTFNSAGTFYWQAVYSGDANNEGATSVCTTETLVVGKAKPSITTTLSAESITVGSSVHDSATLSGATADAGGTVTYTVYADNQCTNFYADAGTKTVANGVVPDSNSLQFDTPGTFYWQAVYSGDANNEGATSVCTTETLVVNKAPSNISTAQTLRPQDSVTLSASAGGTPTGSVTFELFGPNDATCSGAPLYTETVPLTNGTATTSNTSFSVSSATADTYRWKVVYGGDDKHDGATSACGTEQFTLTIQNS